MSYRIPKILTIGGTRLQPSITHVPMRQPIQCQYVQQNCRYMGHTVRIIVTQDVSEGKIYANDIVTVKAGYARNYLIPQKKAVYATRQNFMKYNLKDPELETAEERQKRLEREAIAGDDKDLKAADLLRTYLRNKVLKIWRNVDSSTGADFNTLKPGMVVALNVRQKLSKQLKIDLEKHEMVHICKDDVNYQEMNDKQLDEFVLNTERFGDRDVKCTQTIKTLGQYIARISLRGGYDIPLKFEVVKR